MYVCMYVCMYEIRDRQDLVKGSGWVLFPSTMAEQPIQQIICMYVCMYVCMCMIKIFIGSRGGGRGGGNSERCLKWGGGSGRSLTLKT